MDPSLGRPGDEEGALEAGPPEGLLQEQVRGTGVAGGWGLGPLRPQPGPHL